MKKIICLILLATFIGNLSAQQDNKAKEILDQVSQKNKSYHTIKALFTYSLDNAQEQIHETNKGQILLKGDKYSLQLMGVKTYFDGMIQYSFLEEAQEVTIRETDPEEEGSLNPATIFTLYETGFKYKYIKEQIVKGKKIHSIDLFPTDLDRSFSRIRLMIDQENMQILSLKSVGKDGNNITITVNKFTPNIPVKDSDFVFDTKANPDVEVNDLR